jgi:hypothetical protein
MIFVGLVAIIGGLATAILMSSHGFLLAVLAAPLGGSFFALLGGLYLAYRRSRVRNAVSALEDQTNETPTARSVSSRELV